MLMNKHSKLPREQAGVMLLEALIAILVFSLGILSLVACRPRQSSSLATQSTVPTPRCWPNR